MNHYPGGRWRPKIIAAQHTPTRITRVRKSAPPSWAKKTHSRFAGLWSPAAHRHRYLHLPRSPPPANSLPTERSLVAIEITGSFSRLWICTRLRRRMRPIPSMISRSNLKHRHSTPRRVARSRSAANAGVVTGKWTHFFFFFAPNLLS